MLTLYNIQLALGLLQVALIIILSLDGSLVENLRMMIQVFTMIPRFHSSSDIDALLASFKTGYAVGIVVVVSQTLKISILALAFHLDKIRLMIVSGVIDAINAVLFIVMFAVFIDIAEKHTATHGDDQVSSIGKSIWYQFCVRHFFGIVLSITSASVTYFLVSKLRQTYIQQRN